VMEENQEIPSASEISCFKNIKPRSLIFKANNKDFDDILELIETQFPNVEIVYVTTGPVESFLRVIKSMPLKLQDSSTQLLYSVE
jgi:hypothetical protein